MEEPVKKAVRVTILNQSYTLLTRGDSREVEDLARSVDRLMLSVAARNPNADSTRIAVLACLELADRLRTLREHVDRKTEEFTGLLERVLSGSGEGP